MHISPWNNIIIDLLTSCQCFMPNSEFYEFSQLHLAMQSSCVILLFTKKIQHYDFYLLFQLSIKTNKT